MHKGQAAFVALSEYMCVSGVSSQVELKPEQLTDLPHLTLPSTHTPQQLQQHPDSLMRCVYVCMSLFVYMECALSHIVYKGVCVCVLGQGKCLLTMSEPI